MISVGNTKFIDSVNYYLPMRLSDLPKAFGLKDTLDKGVFPHLLNTKANQIYIGPIPDLSGSDVSYATTEKHIAWVERIGRYYSPDQMKPEERFTKWYEKMIRSNCIFNFQLKIVKYCCNDVDILRRSCMTFRKIFLECDNVCPFEDAQLSLLRA